MIDWQTVTLSLRTHYKPLDQVADEIGMSRQHINRLARGDVAEPRFNSGVRLLDLAYDVLPEPEFNRLKSDGR